MVINMPRKDADIRKHVRERYGGIAKSDDSKSSTPSCCCSAPNPDISELIGYSQGELKSLPEGADLGLGCGNPTALASLKKGEVVLDLGSGAGIDCFLASKKVGKAGKVIGVDMTPEMLEKARRNAEKGGYKNVEFRLGEIENLPVADNSVDVIISNCVINLSPDKKRVFKEAFRALSPGGRIMISDLVTLKELPKAVKESISAYIACIAGALMKDDYLKAIKAAGFKSVKVVEQSIYPIGDISCIDSSASSVIESMELTLKDIEKLQSAIASIKVSAEKPG
jgi:ubiquinone/menaquinone biosynthesis C-methylase UbiE